MAKKVQTNRVLVARVQRRIEEIYKTAATEAAKIGIRLDVPDGAEFSLNKFPTAKRQIEELIDEMGAQIRTTVLNGVESSWAVANGINDALVYKVFGSRFKKLPKAKQLSYLSNNDKALTAFLQTRTGKIEMLSAGVWRQGEVLKQVESAIGLGLSEGKSAAQMSRDLRQYLKEPFKLFRRVRDSEGRLKLSKAAEEYHPGAGVYRSSYKNAMRVARTEINAAYHTADQLRWDNFDFVVGVRITLSAAHPVYDICDELQGDYPKNFRFTGWHPNCLCQMTAILKTEEEMDRDEALIMAGKRVSGESVNRVDDVPQQFKQWTANNEKRLTTAKSMPYFVRDNEKYFPQMRITDAAAKGVKEAQVFSEKSAMQARANVYGNAEVKISEKVLYRGDIRDKGDVFHDTDDVMDYKGGGEAKNKAGFHFFTDSKEYARDYATKQMNQMRGEIQTNILTTVKTDKGLYILDLDKMSLKEQMEFHRSLFDYGINNMQYKQDLICQYKGDFTQKSIDKFFGYSTNGKILNSGQRYSDGDTGVLFKQWLRDNGFDGYAFTMFKHKEYALLNKDMFSVVERKNLSKL